MDKTTFISKLRALVASDGSGFPDEHGHADYRLSRGQGVLMSALADYLERPEIGADRYTNWFSYIGIHIVDAFAEFRSDSRWAAVRAAYADTGAGEIPDLLDVYAGGTKRQLVAYDVIRLVPHIAGQPWLRADLESRLNAQSMAIDNAWRRFVRVAYRKFMARINSERHRGNKGTFGATDLLTYAMAGRVMFTFRRGGDTGPSMTFVADAGDEHGHRSGANHPDAPFLTCVAMIDEVTDQLDIDKMLRCDSAGIA